LPAKHPVASLATTTALSASSQIIALHMNNFLMFGLIHTESLNNKKKISKHHHYLEISFLT